MNEEKDYSINQNYLEAELNEILNGTAVFFDIEDAEQQLEEFFNITSD